MYTCGMVKDTACFCYCVSQDGSKKLWCLRVVATDRPYAKMADILIFFWYFVWYMTSRERQILASVLMVCMWHHVGVHFYTNYENTNMVTMQTTYWNPQGKFGVTTNFSEIIKLPNYLEKIPFTIIYSLKFFKTIFNYLWKICGYS